MCRMMWRSEVGKGVSCFDIPPLVYLAVIALIGTTSRHDYEWHLQRVSVTERSEAFRGNVDECSNKLCHTTCLPLLLIFTITH